MGLTYTSISRRSNITRSRISKDRKFKIQFEQLKSQIKMRPRFLPISKIHCTEFCEPMHKKIGSIFPFIIDLLLLEYIPLI